MSGGYFNYSQYNLQQIADEVEQLIISNDSNEKNEYDEVKGYHFSPETIEEFKRGLMLLKQAHVYAQRIDWLVSGDDGENNFHSRLKSDMEKLS